MTPTPRADKLSVELLEDRTTPTVVIAPEVLNADPDTYAAGQLLFTLAPGVDRTQTLTALGNSPWAYTAQELGFGVFKLILRPGVSVRDAMVGLNENGQLGFVEPDYRMQTRLTPNDPVYPDQWAHNNTGQLGGVPDADIDAPEGWALARGTGQTIVAVLDDGVDSQHPDLAANMWVNAGEIPGNGTDDDGNGFVDDIHGYDFVNNDGNSDPDPGVDHGTHVAGIVGAVGDNALGVAGVAWKARIMGVTVDLSGGLGPLISTATQGFNYAIANGAKIITNSWGYIGNESLALTAAMAGSNAAGVIVTNAVNNIDLNQDTVTDWPANYTDRFDNAVAVTNVTRDNVRNANAAYGPTLTTIAAPGTDIWSTIPGGAYDEFTGTSMATPLVAGALAVVWDAFPGLTYRELIQLMKDTVDPVPDLQGQILTGGRINLHAMLANARLGGYAVGADAGGGPVVRVYTASGTERFSFFAYDPAFGGGVRVAYADVNGDRVPDVITVPGGGGGPNVRVFDGTNLQLLYSFQAYVPNFTSGLYVTAGDVDGDGIVELVTAAGESGGPNVRVFKLDGNGNATLAGSFFAYDSGFTGGVRVAVGDLDGDGVNDIVTAPGFGGGPHVRAFTGASVLAGRPVAIKDFMAGDPNTPFGAYIAVGNLNNDGIGDLIVGSGAHHREVRTYDGRSLALIGGFNVFAPGVSVTPVTDTSPAVGDLIQNVNDPNQLAGGGGGAGSTQTATPTAPFAGLRVAVKDLNNDGIDDIIAVGGPGDQSVVRIRDGSTMATLGNDSAAFGSTFLGGAFVAASR